MPDKNIYNPTLPERKAESDIKSQPERLPARELPMDEYRSEVIEAIDNNDCSIIIGETGSGKTTRIPIYLMEQYPDKKIAVTQPRRLAARSVAKYVAKESGYQLGNEVGFQVRFDDETSPDTRINFQTDGILLKKLQNDRLLSEYDIVMVDEAHERSINIDIILGLLKAAQRGREEAGMSPLKIIVTSATIEKEKFTDFFDQAPAVEVPGRTFGVQVEYAEKPIQDLYSAAADTVEKIVAGGKPGDILIFMPGEDDINRTISLINELKIDDIDVMPLFGSMPPEDQDRIFEKNPKRKVIVSTNIAETSVTIDGIVHVIDSGLIKQKRFDATTGISRLNAEENAQSSCEQRAGRAGRTAPGYCYRLYTEEEFNQREKFQMPEIARSSLDQVILYMKNIGIDNIEDFDFIDPPSRSTITHGLEKLKILGALDEAGKITSDGRLMAELPLSPEKAKMVLESRKYHCVGKVATIAAMQGERPVFIRPREIEDQIKADQAHAEFVDNNSDFLTMLNVWDAWSQSGFDPQWARSKFLNVRQLREIQQVRSQLFRDLSRHGVEVDDSNGDDVGAIQKCIVSGLIDRLMVFSGYHAYQQVFNNVGDMDSESYYMHPASAVFGNEQKLMIGDNVVKTKKVYMRACQTVQPSWLVETVPHLLTAGDKALSFDYTSGRVVEYTDYELKGKMDRELKFKIGRKAPKSEKAAKIFAAAVAERKVETPYSSANENTFNALKELNVRTGGLVSLPDLTKWYEINLQGATSIEDEAISDQELKINFDDFCPLDQAAIDRLYPQSAMIGGRTAMITYSYSPSRTNIFNQQVPEEYYATIRINRETAEDIEEKDVPSIGENGRPLVKFGVAEGYDVRRYDSFAQMKIALREQKTYQTRPAEPRPLAPLTFGRSQFTTSPTLSASGESVGAGLMAAQLNKKLGKEPAKKEKKENAELPKKERKAEQKMEKEIMTDELRATFVEELANARLFIDTADKITKPANPRSSDVEKLQKLKVKIKEIRKELNSFENDMKSIDDPGKIRSKIAELTKKAENAAEQSARLSEKNGDWTKNFRQYMAEIKNLAQEAEVDLTAEAMSKIRSEIAALAQRIIAENEIQAELENIFISNI